MKKRCILLVILLLIFQTFGPSFLYVEASDSDTSICAGPSETMSLYFDFQNEMKTVLLGSRINERRFKVSMGKGGLFSEQVLTLPMSNALDLVASSVWNGTRSMISNTTTTAVLIALSIASVVQSNTEGLAVLFRDRPIVRDYKKMLDIESALFDVAYFRSKQINLTRPVDGNMVEEFTEVVEKYQELGLLAEGTVKLNSETSMSSIIWDLLWMNASMKHFIVYDGGGLDFKGCMNKSKDGNCMAVLEFSEEAKNKLKSDYKRTFGKCNHHFKSLVSKTTKDSLKAGGQDVKKAIDRLKNAFIGIFEEEEDLCGLSYYEISQIRQYRGTDWTCENVPKLQATLPYVLQKKSKQNLRKQQGNSSNIDDKSSTDKVKSKKTTSEKRQEWFYIYGNESEYNPNYSLDMDADFLGIYDSIKTEYDQSEWNIQASDLSIELKKIRGLIDQLDEVIKQSELLNEKLEKIADYQCAN